jgi:TonB-dependent Receptor Plug Domain
MPVFEEQIAPGPLAPGSRYTFTLDSMLWSGALTLSDVLSHVPGVYVARGGFLGRPEYLMYGGRGPTSIEVYRDGMPLYAFGDDSVYVDPGRIPISSLQRVDVEVLPSTLRVFLVSGRHAKVESRSFLRVTSGAFSTAQYAGLFQKRWRSGFALDLGADYLSSEGVPDRSVNDDVFEVWARVEWIPTKRAGAFYEMRRHELQRSLYQASVETPPAIEGKRADFVFGFFYGLRDDGWGLRFDFGLGSTTWTNDSTIDQQMRQAYGRVRYALPTFSLETVGRVGDDRVRNALEGRMGWIPLPGLVVSATGRVRDYGDDRVTKRGGVSVGLYAGPFSVVGELARGREVQAPSLVSDTAQRIDDSGIRAGITTTFLTGQVGLVRRSTFAPLPPPKFPNLPEWDPTPAADFLVVDVNLRPFQPITLSGWFANARPSGGALQPPNQGRVEAAFRSKFWRVFRSGIYDFKVSYGVEFWGTGVAGVLNGTPIELPSATFHEIFVQIQLVDFKLWWNLRNARYTTAEYVPGLPYPRNAQTFGVKWEFFN